MQLALIFLCDLLDPETEVQGFPYYFACLELQGGALLFHFLPHMSIQDCELLGHAKTLSSSVSQLSAPLAPSFQDPQAV